LCLLLEGDYFCFAVLRTFNKNVFYSHLTCMLELPIITSTLLSRTQKMFPKYSKVSLELICLICMVFRSLCHFTAKHVCASCVTKDKTPKFSFYVNGLKDRYPEKCPVSLWLHLFIFPHSYLSCGDHVQTLGDQ